MLDFLEKCQNKTTPQNQQEQEKKKEKADSDTHIGKVSFVSCLKAELQVQMIWADIIITPLGWWLSILLHLSEPQFFQLTIGNNPASVGVYCEVSKRWPMRSSVSCSPYSQESCFWGMSGCTGSGAREREPQAGSLVSTEGPQVGGWKLAASSIAAFLYPIRWWGWCEPVLREKHRLLAKLASMGMEVLSCGVLVPRCPNHLPRGWLWGTGCTFVKVGWAQRSPLTRSVGLLPTPLGIWIAISPFCFLNTWSDVILRSEIVQLTFIWRILQLWGVEKPEQGIPIILIPR